jgi:Kef-type K+ transport system membrane component KefB
MLHAILAGSVLIAVAWLAGRLFRRFVPEVVSFLVVGAALGPAAAGLVTPADLGHLSPVTQVALAALMLAIGERLTRTELAVLGPLARSVIGQSLATSAAVFTAVFVAGGRLPLAIILGALAGGGAPLTMAAVARSLGAAGGTFASRVVTSHALADATAACTFAITYPVAVYLASDRYTLADSLLRFFRLGAASLLLGVALGWVLALVARRTRAANRLLPAAALAVLAATAICSSVRLSLPLVALTMGATVATVVPRPSQRALLAATRPTQEALALTFFALAGTSLQIPLLAKLGAVGAAYIIARAAVKVGAGMLGARRARLAPALAGHYAVASLPQAGAAVALALFADTRLPELHLPTIVLGAVAVFEAGGVLVAVWSLRRADASVTLGTPAESPTVRRAAA